jgi:cell division protein FtsL
VKVRETRKIVYRSKTLPTQEKLLYLFAVAVLVVAAGVILWRYAQIYQMNANILQIQQEMKQLQADNMALKATIGQLQSPGRLEKEATKYGMVPSDESVQQQGQATGAKLTDSKKTAASGTKVAMR